MSIFLLLRTGVKERVCGELKLSGTLVLHDLVHVQSRPIVIVHSTIVLAQSTLTRMVHKKMSTSAVLDGQDVKLQYRPVSPTVG